MAPNRTIRTYGRNTSIASCSRSVDTFNNLFAKNLTIRNVITKRKKKIKIKELPIRRINETLIKSDHSLRVNREDSFDRIANNFAFNIVNFKKSVGTNASSDGESSKSKSSIRFTYRSPIVTRRRSKNKKLNDSTQPETILQRKEVSDIDNSLYIEKEKKNFSKYSSLSYIQLTEDISHEFSVNCKSKDNLGNSKEFSMISKSNYDNNIVSSTPNKKSHMTTMYEMIEQSIEEIKKWDYNFPLNNIVSSTPYHEFENINRMNSNAKSRIYQDIQERRYSESSLYLSGNNNNTRKLIEKRAKMNVSDWKLKSKCKVVLTNDLSNQNNCNESICNIDKKETKEENYITLRRRRIFFTKSNKSKLETSNNLNTNHNKSEKHVEENTSNDSLNKNSGHYEIKTTKKRKLSPSIPKITVEQINLSGTKEINSNKFLQVNLSNSNICADVSNKITKLPYVNLNDNNSLLQVESFDNLNDNMILRNGKKTSRDFISTKSKKPYKSRSKNNLSLNVSVDLVNNYKEQKHTEKTNESIQYIDDSSSFQNETKNYSEYEINTQNFTQTSYDIIQNTPENNFKINYICTRSNKSLSNNRKKLYETEKSPIINFDNCKYVSSPKKGNESKEAIVHLQNLSIESSSINQYNQQSLANLTNFNDSCSGSCKNETEYETEAMVHLTNLNIDLSSSLNENVLSPIQQPIVNLTNLHIEPSSSQDKSDIPSIQQPIINLTNLNIEPISINENETEQAKDLVVELTNMNFDETSYLTNSPLIENQHIKVPFVNVTNTNIDDYLENSLEKSTLIDASFTSTTSNNNINDEKENSNDIKETFKIRTRKDNSFKGISGSAMKRITKRKSPKKSNDNEDIYTEELQLNVKRNSTKSLNFNSPAVKNCSPLKLTNDNNKTNPTNNSSVVIIDDSLGSENNEETIRNNTKGESKIDLDGFALPITPTANRTIKPGKLWRRSLSLVKRNSIISELMNKVNTRNTVFSANRTIVENRLSKRLSIRVVPVFEAVPSTNFSSLENYAQSINLGYVSASAQDINDHLESSFRNLSVNEKSQLSCKRKSSTTLIHNSQQVVTAREVVLRRCGQTEPLPFLQCYPASSLRNCQKIGEGVYGEVFLYRNPNGGTTVMKVIPIEGDRIVNGDRQKKFEEIISEIVIAMELSNLRNTKRNNTNAFSEVLNIRCVQGSYPDRLQDLWDLFDENRGSENDSPSIFTEEQLYIVLELANGGQDLEAFLFTNASQAFSVFKQTACALAIAENEFEFEHRDLHWGNILISNSNAHKKLCFSMDGKEITIATKGVQVAIIDFTLSRIMCEGVVIFNDLSLDPDLFTADGDYQFEIYRLMQKRNENNWQRFEPFSNILWLHYTLDKMISALRYKNVQTKLHREYIEKLKELKEEILTYNSVQDLVIDKFLS